MTGVFLIVISYFSLAFFLVMFFYKARKIAKLPNHLRWELAPVPHEKGRGKYGGSYLEEYEWWTKKREKSLIDEGMYLFKEIFFLRGVHENNKKLWYFSFPFHFGMYILGGMLLLIAMTAILLNFGVTYGNEFLGSAIEIFAIIGFVAALLGTLGLFGRRLLDPNLKSFSTGGTLFNLFILLAVFASGGLALIAVPNFSTEMTAYAKAVFSFDTSAALPNLIAIHCIFGLLFLAYLPFTKMLHFLAKYFTYHEVRWNDAPLQGNSRMEKDIKKHLNQPVSWAAPHLKADGKKNWVDIVTEEDKS